MKNQEWLKLERMAKHGDILPARGLGSTLLRKTETQDEHPEWYTGPCFCRLCMSYAP